MSHHYKFLRSDRLSPFARYRWPVPGEWVEAEVDPCRTGIHACRPADLPYWLDEELWLVELDGPVVETAVKVVARRGRLVRRLDGWNAATAQDLGAACIDRIAWHAAEELRAVGLAESAAALDAGRKLDPAEALSALKESGAEAGTAAKSAGELNAEWLTGYLVYSIDVLDAGLIAAVAYIAARAASRLDDGTDAERAWQAAWLDKRLGLSRRPRLGFLRRR